MATLQIATPEQFELCTELNYAAWGAKVSKEQHVHKEEFLNNTKLRKVHKPYVLLDGGNVVASFETFHSSVYYSRGKEVQKGTAASIASVFVEEKYRGKRYATEMLRKFNEHARKEGYICSDLYSDVKPAIYERVGWREYPAPYVEILASEFSKNSNFSNLISGVQFLGDSINGNILRRILAKEEQTTKLRVQERAKACEDTTVVSYILTQEKLEWMTQTNIFYATVFNMIPSSTIGAFIDEDNYVLWSHDYKEEQMFILKIRSDLPETTQKLLSVAVAEAIQFNLSKVNIWWNLPLSHAIFNNLSITNRVEDSIPMLAWFADGNSKVEWINVEKYSWL